MQTLRSHALLLLAAVAFGCDAAELPADTTTGAPAVTTAPSTETAPVAVGGGQLEVIDPQNPLRPHFRDFGEVPFGIEERFVTTFRNVGDEPLRILSAQAACGCTRVVDALVTPPGGGDEVAPERIGDPALAVVPVGGTVELAIQLITTYSAPNKDKLALVRITTDSALEPYITLEIRFFPSRPFDLAPATAKLLNVPTSHGGEERVKLLVSYPGSPARIHDVVSAPEGLEAELVTETAAGEFVWYVDVRVPPLTPPTALRGDIVLRTTDASGAGEDGRLEIPVVVQVVPDVVLGVPVVAFGRVVRASGRTLETRLSALVPGARIKVLDARLEGEGATGIRLDVVPVEPDGDGRAKVWSVTAEVPAGHPTGGVTGEVVFDLDEPVGGVAEGAATTLRYRLNGTVVEG